MSGEGSPCQEPDRRRPPRTRFIDRTARHGAIQARQPLDLVAFPPPRRVPGLAGRRRAGDVGRCRRAMSDTHQRGHLRGRCRTRIAHRAMSDTHQLGGRQCRAMSDTHQLDAGHGSRSGIPGEGRGTAAAGLGGLGRGSGERERLRRRGGYGRCPDAPPLLVWMPVWMPVHDRLPPSPQDRLPALMPVRDRRTIAARDARVDACPRPRGCLSAVTPAITARSPPDHRPITGDRPRR